MALPSQSDYDWLRQNTSKSVLDQYGKINYQDILNEYLNQANSGQPRLLANAETGMAPVFRSNILGRDVNVSDLGDGTKSFNFISDANKSGYSTVLRPGENGATTLFETERGNDWDFVRDMIKFAGAATGMNLGLNALAGMTSGATSTAAATAAPEAASSGVATGASKAATGGLFGSGMGTGNAVVDNVLQKVLTSAGTSAITGALGGGSGGGQPTSSRPRPTGTGTTGTNTGTSGGFNMADVANPLINALLANYVTNTGGNRITDVTNQSADNIKALSTELSGQGKFTPYNVTTGMGSVADNNGTMTATLDPKWKQFQDSAMSQIQPLLTPYQNQNVSDISGMAYDQSKEWLNKRANPLYEANEQLGLSGAGKLFGVASQFDPEANARKEYDLTQQLFAPTREQDALNMENRLRQQGRLGLNYGSYGAAPELMAMQEANRRQDLQTALSTRQTAFDRQNNLLNQANTMNQFGIQSGAAGTAQNQAYQQMAGNLFNMGLKGDQFIEDMTNSRANRANLFSNMAMAPDKMLLEQMGLSNTLGANRTSAEQSNARLQGQLGMEAERIRSGGAMTDAAIKNDRDKNLLNAVTGGGVAGGAGGLLSGLFGGANGQGNAASAVSGLVKQLMDSGISGDNLSQVMGELGINMEQFLPEGSEWGEFDLSNLDFSGGTFDDWASNNAGWLEEAGLSIDDILSF